MKIKLPSHSSIYFFGLLLMAIGLPFSTFLMSLSQFVLVGNWITEGNIKQKLTSFWRNKSAVILSSVFILHLIGLFYSSDFNYAFRDIRVKLPILIFPLIISTSEPLSKKRIHQLMLFFIASVAAATFVSTAILLGITNKLIVDIRQISIFISHIRFSLLICISIFFLGYFTYCQKSYFKKSLAILFIIWFITFLFILESLTGLVILSITGFILLVYFTLSQKKLIYRLSGLAIIALLVFGAISYVRTVTYRYYSKNHPQHTISKPEQFTPNGNPYFHEITNTAVENGNYVWQYISWTELEEEWNKRSNIHLEEKDLKGNDIKYTLIRFLTSKGHRKDAEGIQQLTEQEIQAIQKGIANVNYLNVPGIKARIYQVIWEIDNYRRGENPSGHSVAQRFEYWKAAIGIVKENFLFGVGTGDVKAAFDAQYKKTNSSLSNEWRLRSHNQYLAIAVAFGVVGLIWFLFSFVYPLFKERKYFDYFYMTFFIIVILSMLTEDTLETQAGISFFVFFNTLFLFAAGKKEQ